MAKKKKAPATKVSAKTTTTKTSKAKKKGPKKGSTRKTYADSLKAKVVKAIRKGMTHLEASKAFEVGVHSIPNWLKRH